MWLKLADMLQSYMKREGWTAKQALFPSENEF